MKGNIEVIARLNARLADELTAINQYIVHSEMCSNWGYAKLAGAMKQRAIAEMKHAESLIERIIFLEGTPVVSTLNAIKIGATVEQQHANDWEAEHGAIDSYNADILFALNAGDNTTRELLAANLAAEEEHINWVEEQLDQIRQMGIQNYLAGQIG